MAALGRTSALVAAALFLCLAAAGSETPEASDRQHRGGFQKLRLSTARGFGKRIPPGLAFLRQRNQEPADPIIKKGFRKMKISTARGFGKREDPDLSFLLENEDMDPVDLKEKRGIRRLSLSTARGFGKRMSPGFSDDQGPSDAGQSGGGWLPEEIAKVADISDDGLAYQDSF